MLAVSLWLRRRSFGTAIEQLIVLPAVTRAATFCAIQSPALVAQRVIFGAAAAMQKAPGTRDSSG